MPWRLEDVLKERGASALRSRGGRGARRVLFLRGIRDRITQDGSVFVARFDCLSLLGLLSNNPACAQDTSVREHDAVINGVTIHYLRAGSGDPIVLVHGYPENSHTWRHVIPTLARNYTVIAPDTRGTGRSSITMAFELRDAAEDIHGLVHHLGFRRIFLVGHDFGVPVVAAYAAMHRDEMRALVVAEAPLSAYGLEALYPKFWHFGFLASKYALLLVGDNIDPFFRQFSFSDFVYQKAAFSKSEIDGYIAAEARPGLCQSDAARIFSRSLS